MVLQSSGAIIRHADINSNPALFLSDGVHLSPLGYYIFLCPEGLEAMVYTVFLPIQVREMVWVRLFLFAAL